MEVLCNEEFTQRETTERAVCYWSLCRPWSPGCNGKTLSAWLDLRYQLCEDRKNLLQYERNFQRLLIILEAMRKGVI